MKANVVLVDRTVRVGLGMLLLASPLLARLARTSSSVSWAELGSTPGVMTPPVAKILMTSAPALSCSRTALRTSSGPSDSRPINLQPWPPVMQMPRPAQS